MYCKCKICYSRQVVSGCLIGAKVVDVLQVSGCLIGAEVVDVLQL